jgi:hypothetical protein
MGIRNYVIDEITKKLPKAWNFIPYQSNFDELGAKHPVILLKLQGFKRSPAAPTGLNVAEYVLTIVVPGTDPEPVENDLDDKIIDLVHAIEGIKNLTWTEAKRVTVGATNQGYDITLEVTTQKE